jgi:hypothetical protein
MRLDEPDGYVADEHMKEEKKRRKRGEKIRNEADEKGNSETQLSPGKKKIERRVRNRT